MKKIGNLAPEGAVGKITGKEGMGFTGPVRTIFQAPDMIAPVTRSRYSFFFFAAEDKRRAALMPRKT